MRRPVRHRSKVAAAVEPISPVLFTLAPCRRNKWLRERYMVKKLPTAAISNMHARMPSLYIVSDSLFRTNVQCKCPLPASSQGALSVEGLGWENGIATSD